VFNNINHYLARRMFLHVGNDIWYPPYEGYINNLKLLLCTGAYNPDYKPG
jgi:hypothetical protein